MPFAMLRVIKQPRRRMDWMIFSARWRKRSATATWSVRVMASITRVVVPCLRCAWDINSWSGILECWRERKIHSAMHSITAASNNSRAHPACCSRGSCDFLITSSGGRALCENCNFRSFVSGPNQERDILTNAIHVNTQVKPEYKISSLGQR